MKSMFLALTVLLLSSICLGQKYLKPNEEVVCSFQTTGKKWVYLVKDKSNQYMTYRYGTKDQIELDFPGTGKDSWQQFTYSFYFRGGGISNAGMDLNYLSFTRNGFRYVLYHTYQAAENEVQIGISVTNLNTAKTTDIKGNYKTLKGSLVDFRYNGLVPIGEELFD